MKDYYAILGVSKDASSKNIKAAYRKLVLANHPDKTKTNNSDKIHDINEANETLGNEDKKRQYDEARNRPQDMHMGMNGMNGMHFANFNEIFAQHFGANFNMHNPHMQQQQQQQQQQQRQEIVENINVSINLDIFECFQGVNKTVNIELSDDCSKCSIKCQNCSGNGIVEKTEMRQVPGMGIAFTTKTIGNCDICSGKGLVYTNPSCSNCNNTRKISTKENLTVYIFPGIEENQIMNTRIQKNSKNYNIIIKSNIDYNNYRRTGNNLICDINIPFIDTIIGHSYKIKLPDSTETIIDSTEFKEIIQHKKIYLSKFKGLPNYDINNKKINNYGTLSFEYNVIYPSINIDAVKSNKDSIYDNLSKYM